MSRAEQPTAVRARFLRDYTVLFVDDESANRLVFDAEFAEEFRVRCAESAAEALEILDQEPISVVMTDHRMPGLTGIELCERIRDQFPGVLRLVVTAFPDQQNAIDAINRGEVIRYLVKPWDLNEVRQVLREAVARSHLEATVRALRNAMVQKERLEGMAAARARILHDLSNLNTALTICSTSLRELIQQLRGDVGDALFEELEAEVTDLSAAVNFVSKLHEKTNGMADVHRPQADYHRAIDLVGMVAELARVDMAGIARLVVHCTEDAALWADRTDTSRILVNLVKNAKHAIASHGVDGGRVEIRVTEEGGTIAFLVSDNGPGILEEIRDRVFEDLFTTRGGDGGSGLGLAICRELAVANGGYVELLPSGEAGGATFLLTLPAKAPERP